MLNRWSVNALLKSVILIMSSAIVLMLALRAWDAYDRYGVASRVSVLTDASGSVFRAMNGLRLDRSFTDRALKAETVAPQDRKQIMDARDAGMPALKLAVDTLAKVNFPGQQNYLAIMQRALASLPGLQAESAAAFDKPKADRRADLGTTYFNLTNGLIDDLERLCQQLAAEAKMKDSFIDE